MAPSGSTAALRRFSLLPRATLKDVVRGAAPIVGARVRGDLARGLVSPVESRVVLGIGYEDLAEAEGRYLAAAPSLRRGLGVVARACVARLLTLGADGVVERRPWIVSATVDNVTIADAIELVFAEPPSSRARVVHYAHAHALTVARGNASLAQAFADADAVLPDGVGIRVAASILGKRMLDNVNGTDMLPHLCRYAAANGIPLVLVGGQPGIAEACADNLRAAHPGLSIPLIADGFKTPDETIALRESIKNVGRCLVLVGMGSPIQERWTWEHLADIGGITALTVGGLFDFYSGRVRRAPVALREMGLEWAWRLLQEPGRLAKRYLLGNPRFLSLALFDRVFRVRRRAVIRSPLLAEMTQDDAPDSAAAPLRSGMRLVAAKSDAGAVTAWAPHSVVVESEADSLPKVARA